MQRERELLISVAKHKGSSRRRCALPTFHLAHLAIGRAKDMLINARRGFPCPSLIRHDRATRLPRRKRREQWLF
tara:strand:+ start:187 stop:408 length:222 start_codon:yes stop_codon:yes gene_type:complete